VTTVSRPAVAETADELHRLRGALPGPVALVPTMGALHEGHRTLVRAARERASTVVVSVFVNPTQFGPGEDFDRYPRTWDADLAALAEEGADLVFHPEVDEAYPPGAAGVTVDPGPLGSVLEGAVRPGHFAGVLTVVAKLFGLVRPDLALFGEKDYQQLLVIRRMVRDLDVPVRIHGVPTVRESDGLALSSRNAYLTAAERAIAPTLHRTITAVAQAVAEGGSPEREASLAAGALVRTGFRKVDYVAVRDAETLGPVSDASRPARVLAAAWLGRARLIDNVPVISR
jgi:pantoate--beta-alanine ligase